MKTFIKNWMLPISIISGICLYLIYYSLPLLHPAGGVLLHCVSVIQPLLLFAMLFLTFCRIEPKQLKPHRWQWWIMLVQLLLFATLGAFACLAEKESSKVLWECAMLCMICPTATAAAVVTDKLGGDLAGVITYTILINIATSIAVPLIVPLLHPAEDLSFVHAFSLILAKVFPLLICPCLLAWMVRYMSPKLLRKITKWKDLPFNLWAVSLTLALTMTTRGMIHSQAPLSILFEIGLISLACCIFQFVCGKFIGGRYGQSITAGQAFGQKNTVLAIWIGYTFLSPVTAVAGGFYSIWHNCFNSWQLYRQRKRESIG